ncbi:MarR family winged helix-turn-helix transcriptional regulator [Granulicoccus sp. GXG6511]|uniref:MarR family winged helix-turn-helix transcriptional regulator n=1 Tax=Granulicoccus sp. GXG6511 TaxID=3381351 RepID=UPI003D7CB535
MDTSAPRWLSADERAAWLALVGVTIQLPSALDQRLKKAAGIGLVDYHVLAGLSDAPDRTLRMSALAEFAQASLSRLSQMVGRLEKRDWVRRFPDPTDGRYTLAHLTDEGMAALEELAPPHVEDVRELVFDALSPDQVAQLHEISDRILRAIDPVHVNGTPIV